MVEVMIKRLKKAVMCALKLEEDCKSDFNIIIWMPSSPQLVPDGDLLMESTTISGVICVSKKISLVMNDEVGVGSDSLVDHIEVYNEVASVIMSVVGDVGCSGVILWRWDFLNNWIASINDRCGSM